MKSLHVCAAALGSTSAVGRLSAAAGSASMEKTDGKRMFDDERSVILLQLFVVFALGLDPFIMEM